jgi:hypothetical protein
MGNQLKPFFCYFGGKWRAAPRYPAPRYQTIVEPFAGAAGYALRHHERNVILYEVDEAVYGIWDYLLRTPREEVLALPVDLNHVDEMIGAPQEAKWLVGMWLNKGGTTPKLSASTWARSGIRPNSYWGTVIRQRIADQLPHIRHWKLVNKSFTEAPNTAATWFIDPPYEGDSGRLYRHRVKDYRALGEWCRARQGQVIVCEKAGATWLPFSKLATIKATPGSRGKSYSREVMWVA